MKALEINFSSTFNLPMTEFVQIARSIAIATGDPGHIAISIALQVCAAGGVEAHAKTMSADSVWMSDIYPVVKDQDIGTIYISLDKEYNEYN